jgi:hypothetical protein
MARRLLALAAAGGAAMALLGCRPATVSVAYAPQVGDRYAYRYEIETTVTRTLEGAEPEVVHLDTELVARQEVRARTARGARIRLELTREGGATRTAVAIVDRAGSLEGVELVEGLGAAVFGVADEEALVPTHLTGPPDRPLAPGDRWSIGSRGRREEGRLLRLGVIDDSDVAVVHTTATEDLARSVRAGASATQVSGRVRSGATTSYDLADGAIRRSSSWSRGQIDAELQPPEGVIAEPVHATIGYEVTVRVTRID